MDGGFCITLSRRLNDKDGSHYGDWSVNFPHPRKSLFVLGFAAFEVQCDISGIVHCNKTTIS